MKSMLRIMAVCVTIGLLICCLPCAASAELEQGISTCALTDGGLVGDECIIYGGGSSYGFTGWQSFSAAVSYYGSQYTYTSCSHYHNSSYYNYYYTFSTGERMYFGVLE